jgi:uncharacterized membrane protein YqjE
LDYASGGQTVLTNEKSIGAILTETKEELKEFAVTRVEMLKAEMSEKLKKWMAAGPLLIVALVFSLTAWFTLTFALVALLHAAFLPSAYSWLWASLIVTFVYLVIGAICGATAYKRISQTSLKPTRTMEVLKQDQAWIQNEARTA